MLIDAIPYLLVLMSWNAEDPQATIRVTHRLLATQEQCLEAGREREEFFALLPDNARQGREFVWACAEQPSRIELGDSGSEEK